jgi:excisionase family DNA binding protein
MQKQEAPEVLMVDEVAEILRTHPGPAYRLIRASQPPAVRLGRAVGVRREALDRWMAERGAPASPSAPTYGCL